jgi:hypothetical protein
MCYIVPHCRFIFSPEGSFFRTFLLDEVVKSIDALSREQLVLLVQRLGLSGVRLPVLLPGVYHINAKYEQAKCEQTTAAALGFLRQKPERQRWWLMDEET